jgi:hypothetical protein
MSDFYTGNKILSFFNLEMSLFLWVWNWQIVVFIQLSLSFKEIANKLQYVLFLFLSTL